jgi:uncharacterized phage protein (TIGR02220 family)
MEFLKIKLDLVKKVGMHEALLFSYLVSKSNNSPNFFSLKLKTIQKDLDFKKYKLNKAIEFLKKEKLIMTKQKKDKIFLDVSFQILCNENTKPYGAKIGNNTALKPINTGAKIGNNTASLSGLKLVTTPHKHGAASIIPIINKLIILKEKRNLLKSDVRKKVLKLLKPCLFKSEGSDNKITTVSESQKQPKMNSKTKTDTKARGELSEEEIRQVEAEEILKYLNKKAGKDFDVSMESHLKLIKDRLEKYTFEDCIRVIDVKVEQWAGKTFDGVPAENYLQPSTLFQRAKFDRYKNEKIADKSKKQFQNQLEENLFNFFQKSGCQGNKSR